MTSIRLHHLQVYLGRHDDDDDDVLAGPGALHFVTILIILPNSCVFYRVPSMLHGKLQRWGVRRVSEAMAGDIHIAIVMVAMNGGSISWGNE